MLIMTSAGLVQTGFTSGSNGVLNTIEMMARLVFAASFTQKDPVLKNNRPLETGDWMDIPRTTPEPGCMAGTHDRVWVMDHGFSLQAPPVTQEQGARHEN